MQQLSMGKSLPKETMATSRVKKKNSPVNRSLIQNKCFLPSLHIKLGLMKSFKATDQNHRKFLYLKLKGKLL
jgi:hypothetical protein